MTFFELFEHVFAFFAYSYLGPTICISDAFVQVNGLDGPFSGKTPQRLVIKATPEETA